MIQKRHTKNTGQTQDQTQDTRIAQALYHFLFTGARCTRRGKHILQFYTYLYCD